MSESIAEVRKRSWKTRREKYGAQGHSGAYRHPQVIYTAPWNERLRTMQDALIKLYREGVLSEGQVSKATGLDRVSCRDLAIQQTAKEPPYEGQSFHVRGCPCYAPQAPDNEPECGRGCPHCTCSKPQKLNEETMTKKEATELEQKADPFRRIVAINHPFMTATHKAQPLRDFVPGVWPTWGEFLDLMEAVKVLVEKGKAQP